MPASQAAVTERRNDRTVAHEPPKLKTTFKTPPKQATNPLQFVKVGPCSLYRTAQEQLQKVQEVKKIKQEVREDPEDWQSNLDNWKSSRRKRQEHIIERVVEVKKLELEEHDRQRRRSKTFSEMMEERGNRGRKLSISLAMYQEEDSNDLSDLGIGTSSGKSSISGDTHDDAHSVLSDRDSEIEKNHSDLDGAPTENGNEPESLKKSTFENGFHNNHNSHEYDSAATATASSPEPEEYTYEGAIRGYVSRVSQNIPRRSLVNLDAKLDNSKSSTNSSKTSLNEETNGPVVKVDIFKRREIFEKALQKNTDSKANSRLGSEFASSKSIKERLSNLEKQKNESENVEKSSSKALNRLSGDMNSIRERLSHLEKQASEREKINNHGEDLESVRPLRERLSTLQKYNNNDESSTIATVHESRFNGELSARTIKDRLCALDAARNKELEKRNSSAKHNLCFRDQENRVDTSTPSERSSSPDSEYRAPRAAFHRSLDSLDADASSGPDTFERVQSLEELDYVRRYPASSSSAEILNDTDREDSGIHTADVSCSVSQADEPVDEETLHNHVERQQIIEEKPEVQILEVMKIIKKELREERPVMEETIVDSQQDTVTTIKGTDESSSGGQATNKSQPQTVVFTNISNHSSSSSSRPIVYQSPKIPPRRTPPEILKTKSFSMIKPSEHPSFQDHLENKVSEAHVQVDVTENSSKEKTFTNVDTNLFLESSDSSMNSSPDSLLTPTFPISILRPKSNATCSLMNPQESKSTPCTSPRTSKIPTPLPRKNIIKSSPTGSTSSLSSPISPSSLKFSSPKLRSSLKTSEIPVPISTSPSTVSKVHFSKTEDMNSCKSFIPTSSSPSSPTKSTQVMDSRTAEKRLTVVEIYEKVVVPQGQAPPTPPVTPFITVECFKNSQSSEVRIDQQNNVSL